MIVLNLFFAFLLAGFSKTEQHMIPFLSPFIQQVSDLKKDSEGPNQPNHLQTAKCYQSNPQHQVVEDIQYIVQTLANRSLYSILKQRSSLEAAGARLEPVHPLAFIKVIATDPALVKDFKKLKKSFWSWGHFSKGLYRSLHEEAAAGNITDENIIDFCRATGKDVEKTKTLILAKKWHDLIEYIFN